VVTGYTSINACVKAELFPTGVRALGVALPYALVEYVTMRETEDLDPARVKAREASTVTPAS